MTVEVKIHLDLANPGTSDSKAVWWAESDDVPGFTAAADSLADLRRRAEAALDDMLDLGVVEVVWRLVGEMPSGSSGAEFVTRVAV